MKWTVNLHLFDFRQLPRSYFTQKWFWSPPRVVNEKASHNHSARHTDRVCALYTIFLAELIIYTHITQNLINYLQIKALTSAHASSIPVSLHFLPHSSLINLMQWHWCLPIQMFGWSCIHEWYVLSMIVYLLISYTNTQAMTKPSSASQFALQSLSACRPLAQMFNLSYIRCLTANLLYRCYVTCAAALLTSCTNVILHSLPHC